MPNFVIGDIQGCYLTLQRLLKGMSFDPAQDRLWLVGDLVNRGPRSLQALRWARSLGGSLKMVLGNHDLHLLARAAGMASAKPGDTLDEVLNAPDATDLLKWLRERPLLHQEGAFAMVHGGIHPDWTLEEATERARKAEEALAGPHWRETLGTLTNSLFPKRKKTPEEKYLRQTLKVLTRLRMSREDGEPDFDYKGPPHQAPHGLKPWVFLSPKKKGKRHPPLRPLGGLRSRSGTQAHRGGYGLRLGQGIDGRSTGGSTGVSGALSRLDDSVGEMNTPVF